MEADGQLDAVQQQVEDASMGPPDHTIHEGQAGSTVEDDFVPMLDPAVHHPPSAAQEAEVAAEQVVAEVAPEIDMQDATPCANAPVLAMSSATEPMFFTGSREEQYGDEENEGAGVAEASLDMEGTAEEGNAEDAQLNAAVDVQQADSEGMVDESGYLVDDDGKQEKHEVDTDLVGNGVEAMQEQEETVVAVQAEVAGVENTATESTAADTTATVGSAIEVVAAGSTAVKAPAQVKPAQKQQTQKQLRQGLKRAAEGAPGAGEPGGSLPLDKKQKKTNENKNKPKVRNFAITMYCAPGDAKRARVVALPGPQWWRSRRVVGHGPAVDLPSRLYRGGGVFKSAQIRDTREVTRKEETVGKPPLIQMKVTLGLPNLFYLHKLCTVAVVDPCLMPDPAYEEGIRRTNQFLDEKSIKEVMSTHFELRQHPVQEMGRANLARITNKQAWMLVNCRQSRGKPTHDVPFSKIYTLGCYRIASLINPARAVELLLRLPMRKRKYLVYTLGSAEWTHMQDHPDSYFRLLVHEFTPPDLVQEMLALAPLPGPVPRGNIKVALLPGARPQLPPRGPHDQGGPGAGRFQRMSDDFPRPGHMGGTRGPMQGSGTGGGPHGPMQTMYASGGPGGPGRMVRAPPAPSHGPMQRGGGGSGARGQDKPPGMGGQMQALPRAPAFNDSRAAAPPRQGGHFDETYGRPGRAGSREARAARAGPPPDSRGWSGGREVPLPDPVQESHRGYGVAGGRASEGSRYATPIAVERTGGGGGWAVTPRSEDGRGNAPTSSGRYGAGGDSGGQGSSGARNQTPARGQDRGVEGDQTGRGAGFRSPPAAPQDAWLARTGTVSQQQTMQGQDYGKLPAPPPRQQQVGGGGGVAGYSGGYAQPQQRQGWESQDQDMRQAGVPLPSAPGIGTNLMNALSSLLSTPGMLPPQAGAGGQIGRGQQVELQRQLQTVQQQLAQQQQALVVRQGQAPASDATAAVAAALALQQHAAQQQQLQQQVAQLQQALTMMQQQQQKGGPVAHQDVGHGGHVGYGGMQQQGPIRLPQPPPMPQQQLQPVQAQLPPAGGPHRRLKLKAAGAATPAPWRASLPSGGMQSAALGVFSLGNFCVAVADGLAATRQLGVDSAGWAKALADTAVRLGDSAVQEAMQTGRALPRPSDLLTAALERVPGSGAASCCLAILAGSEMHVAIAGTCGVAVLRAQTSAGEMIPVSGWRPYVDPGARQGHLASRDLAPLVGCAAPGSITEERLPLAPGDMVVLGSHGLWDMVWFFGPPSTNLRRELYSLGYKDQVDAQLIANQLTSLAANMGNTSALSGAPLASQLTKEGRAPVLMQDVGDNAAVLCSVQQM